MQRRTVVSGVLTLTSPLLIVCGLLAAGSSAAPAQRISGSLQAQETTVAEDPGVSFVTDGSGGGIATHLGRFTVDWEFTVNEVDGTGSGPARYTAANGDQIFVTSDGRSNPTATPGVYHIMETQKVTGGTGRYLGAEGGFIVERLVDLTTGLTSGTFQGMITSPGAR